MSLAIANGLPPKVSSSSALDAGRKIDLRFSSSCPKEYEVILSHHLSDSYIIGIAFSSRTFVVRQHNVNIISLNYEISFLVQRRILLKKCQ